MPSSSGASRSEIPPSKPTRSQTVLARPDQDLCNCQGNITRSQLDPNFVFEINVAGVKPFAPGAQLEAGFYKGRVIEYGALTVNTNKGPAPKISITLDIGGVQRSLDAWVPSADATPEQAANAQKRWRALLESAGYTDAQIGSGSVKVARGAFMDREMHIEVRKELNETDGKTYDRLFAWAPTDWSKAKENFEKAGGAAAAQPMTRAATGGAAAGAQTLGGGAQALGGARQAPAVTMPAQAAAPNGVSTAALLGALGGQ